MSYTNVDISTRNEETHKRFKLLEAELTYYKNHSAELQNKLDNIPMAIEDWGYVEIINGDKTLKLVQEVKE